MANDAQEMALLMENLNVDGATESMATQKAPDAMEELRIQAIATLALVGRVQNILTGAESSTGEAAHSELFVMGGCEKLTSAIRRACEVIVNHVTESLGELGKPNAVEKEMLSYFHGELQNISRKVMASAGEGCSMWMIAEECYRQSIDGRLHPDSYYDQIEKAADISEDSKISAKEKTFDSIYQPIRELKEQIRSGTNERWVGFWVRALCACPDGPTLFYPPASHVSIRSRWMESPSKLFRAFDERSPGVNNDRLMASWATTGDHKENCRLDILQTPKLEAKSQLEAHLNRQTIDRAERTDNLVSWTSSLLYATYYAIYRSRRFGVSTDRVIVCAVDPSDFAQGQFARDKALIEICWDPVAADRDRYDFFNFRLRRLEYDNGEYLTQGRLSIKQRSSVVTLRQLVQAGLYQLYPELAEEPEKLEWTNRVKDLRLAWREAVVTKQTDIKRALTLAKCFPRFDAADMALAFLTVRPRKLNQAFASNEIFANPFDEEGYKFGPAEVKRYHDLLQRRKSMPDSCTVSDEVLLEQLFECAD